MILGSRKRLQGLVDPARIEAAIRAAELKTSGEIRVSVARFFWGNVRNVAERAFDRLGMRDTRDRNGVLFFVVPSRRQFVVLGDEGIHAKVGEEFWEKVAAIVGERFRAGQYTDGLAFGIAEVGQQLRSHFPYDAKTDANELPDAVDYEE